MSPESIDFDTIKPLLLAALERRHARRRAEQPPMRISAAAIARRFGIRPHGSLDSQKRGVRLVIDALRREGKPILSDFKGYYLSAGAADDHRYVDFRRTMGVAHLAAGAAVERSEAHQDAAGQLGLFNERSKRVRESQAGQFSTENCGQPRAEGAPSAEGFRPS